MTNLPVWNPITKKWTLEQVGSLWVPAQVNGQQQQQIVALDGLLAMIGNGSGGGGGGGGVRRFNGRKGIVVSEFGDYGTDLIENDSSADAFSGLTTATGMLETCVSVTFQTIDITNPVDGQMSSSTRKTIQVRVTSDNDQNLLNVPNGLSYLTNRWQDWEIINEDDSHNFILSGVVAQTFNGQATYVVSPGMAVRMRLVDDNAWLVTSSGPSQFRDAIAIAAPGTTVIPALAADETIYAVTNNAVGGIVELPELTIPALPFNRRRKLWIFNNGTQTLNVQPNAANTLNGGATTLDLAVGEGTLFQPVGSSIWAYVIGGTIVP